MINASLEQIAKAVDGTLILPQSLLAQSASSQATSPQTLVINHVTTDTRAITKGALFVALKGEKFDGHNFIEQAIENGASALLISKPALVSEVNSDEILEETKVAQIVVKDTQLALGQLAKWVHQQSPVKTLALTGSCGKTTVKEMLHAILQQKGKVLYTAGNFNNEIGVPLTLLRRENDDDYAVIELGANHLGEIAYTTQLAMPDIALVNNVAAAHLEGFGSLDGVAKAKGEIFEGLSDSGIAVVNLDSGSLDKYWKTPLEDKRVVTFSVTQNSADFHATQIAVDDRGHASFTLKTPQGSFDVRLPMIGQHNIANALAAAAMAMNAGATIEEIKAGLELPTKVKGRVEAIDLTSNIRLIDDSYNASVPAMKAAADLLSHYSGKKWLILGFMAELGEQSALLHKAVGEHAAQYGFDYVLTYGEDTRVISQICSENIDKKHKTYGQHFATHDILLDFICQELATNLAEQHTLLVKGANSARMSCIVAALKEKYL